MKTSNISKTSFTIATLVALFTSSAHAATTISVTNYSFEADENTDSGGAFNQGTQTIFGGQLTGWISQSDATTGVPVGSGIAVGWKDITPSELDPSPAVGGQESQALSLQAGASVLNTTGTAWSSFNVGDQLTLTISLGMRNVLTLNWNEGTFFGLTDGDADFTAIDLSDTVANSGIIANNPVTGDQLGDGTFTDVSFVHTVTGGDLTRTGNIGIFINAGVGTGATGSSNQSFFDNVRLDVTAVPEPSAALLGGLGVLLLLLRRCR